MRAIVLPSKLHETIAEMLRASPELVLTLVRAVSALPEGATARRVGEGMSSPLVGDYRPDNVIEVLTADGALERVIVCEVQLQRDASKLLSLPVYQTLARARHDAPCEVVVVTPDPKIARWLAEPIELGGGSIFRATVIGPTQLAQIRETDSTDDGRASRLPLEVGFLQLLGKNEPEQIVHFAGRLLRERPLHAQLYFDLIVADLPEETRKAVESLMGNYEYQSEFAKKYFKQGLEEGIEKGIEKGIEQGIETSLAALRASLRRELDARGVLLSGEHIQALDACVDFDELMRWNRKAATAKTSADVFG